MNKPLKILVQAGRAWSNDNVFKHSAAVSFCALFSLAPITIIALTLAGVFLGQDEAGRELELQLTQLVGPASAQMITAAARASEQQRHGAWATGIGIVLMLVGATTMFGQLQQSLNEIWGVRTRPSKSGWTILILHRLVSFAMVLTVGFLLLISLILTTILTSALGRFGATASWFSLAPEFADAVVSMGVVSVLFALIFKVMPDVRLRWREVWLGAFLTAGLFTIGRCLIAIYLSHSNVASIYGTAGSLVALLLWVYYSCAIFFYGAEFMRAFRSVHGLPIEPKETAVRVGR